MTLSRKDASYAVAEARRRTQIPKISAVPGIAELPAGGHPDFYQRIQEYHRAVERCTRCVLDVNTPSIEFDNEGVCNYCRTVDALEEDYPNGKEGGLILEKTVDEIKRAGRGKPFDVIIGVSGGCDSSYMVIKAKEWGLRPLAAHFDNTWNSTIATRNIHTVLDKLGVELHTHVVDNEEYNDVCRAFIKAGVIDIETPTDIGLATTLYQTSAKYGVKYQFEGHSFRTEGIGPLGWFYMDGKYIESIVKEYGHYSSHRLRTFPNLKLGAFLKWMLWNRVKKIRPLYYVDYQKEETKEFLSSRFGWQWYGGHHLENRFTSFYHRHFLPTRFKIDTRSLGFSALIRSNQMSRSEGLRLMSEPPGCDPEIIEMVKKRLRFSDVEYERVMTQPRRSFRDFKTYKKTFERLRGFFWIMYKLDLVPKSFYIKYTSASNI